MSFQFCCFSRKALAVKTQKIEVEQSQSKVPQVNSVLQHNSIPDETATKKPNPTILSILQEQENVEGEATVKRVTFESSPSSRARGNRKP